MLHCVWTFCPVGCYTGLCNSVARFEMNRDHVFVFVTKQTWYTLQNMRIYTDITKYICIHMHASMHTFIQKIKTMKLHPRKRGEKGKRKIHNFSGTSTTTSVLTFLPSKAIRLWSMLNTTKPPFTTLKSDV